MCLAIPGEVIQINKSKATVDFGGIKRQADLSLVRKIKIGDYVLVHAGFAIQKVDQVVAKSTYRLLAEVDMDDQK